MRVLIAATLLALGVACASAADIPADLSENYSTRSFGAGHRAGMLVVYDFEPGVNVRAYWLAPWRHRHYFPRTGERPEIGRDEDLSAPRIHQKPAESFRRHWSNASAFAHEMPLLPAQRLATEPPQIPAPLK